MRTSFVFLAVPLALALAAAGCGGGGSSSSTALTVDCRKGSALTGASGLPADFPAPGELVLTQRSKQGPTLVLDGYYDSPDLDKAYEELLAQAKAANYKVLFTENEHKDAEISYGAPDGTTGQIALHADCNESHTTRVHITSRPK
jgi:hypothetical protein